MATKKRAAVPILVALVAAAFGAFSASAGDRASSATASWQLMDYHQSACFSSRVTSSYYGIWIRGSWTRPIDVGAARLPAGGRFTPTDSPIPPGSSTGEYSLAYVRVDLLPNTPLGTYRARLWAKDGVTRQTVPIKLEVKEKCGY